MCELRYKTSHWLLPDDFTLRLHMPDDMLPYFKYIFRLSKKAENYQDLMLLQIFRYYARKRCNIHVIDTIVLNCR